MDVKSYIQIIIKNWRVLLVSVAVTVAATLIFTLRQPRVYESETTFVIRPHSSLIVQDDFVRTLETLSRRVEINSTFAEVAGSKLIKDQATEKLGLDSGQLRGLSVDGRVLAGTNILKLTVKGNDPLVAQAFAEAISQETVAYVSSLYDVFELGQLDSASLSNRPISPNVLVNLAMGLVLGIGLGLAIIYISEYWRAPGGQRRHYDIIDPDTGVYSRAYLEMRLRQEVSRARRNGGHLSVSLIRVKDRAALNSNSGAGREAMPSVAALFSALLRDEDLMARFDDTTFALMLPDLSGQEAKSAVEELRLRLGSATVSLDQFLGTSTFRGIASVAELNDGDANEEELLKGALVALRDAERGTYGRVILRDAPVTSQPNQAQVDSRLSPQNSAPANGVVAPANGAVALSYPAPVDKTPAVQMPADRLPIVVDDDSEPLLTRAALKLVQQHGIDPGTVEGTGKDGRILKSDVKKVIKSDQDLGLAAQS
jgi:diguanylate cyclase (GGDEF)-like protein